MRRVRRYDCFGLLFVTGIPAEEIVSFVRDGGESYLRAFFNHSAVAEINRLTVFGDITPVTFVALRKEVEFFHDSDGYYFF